MIRGWFVTRVSAGHVRRIYRLSSISARGEDAADVILAAQSELTSLLRLRDCRFEALPFATTMERLERTGTVSWRALRLRRGRLELSSGRVELPVLGRGSLLGRFVLDPTPGVGVSLEQRIVAVILADQVGAVLASSVPGASGTMVR